MLAVAPQISNVFAVFAHLAAELLAIRADAGTTRVSAFPGFWHGSLLTA